MAHRKPTPIRRTDHMTIKTPLALGTSLSLLLFAILMRAELLGAGYWLDFAFSCIVLIAAMSIFSVRNTKYIFSLAFVTFGLALFIRSAQF